MLRTEDVPNLTHAATNTHAQVGKYFLAESVPGRPYGCFATVINVLCRSPEALEVFEATQKRLRPLRKCRDSMN
jgi:hypothetical protein